MRSFELAEYLLKEAKIITVPGLEYGPSRDFYLRFPFTTSMEKIETGLDRLENSLDKLH
jgi:aspartate/methionine/tyrosine aminotransferase